MPSTVEFETSVVKTEGQANRVADALFSNPRICRVRSLVHRRYGVCGIRPKAGFVPRVAHVARFLIVDFVAAANSDD